MSEKEIRLICHELILTNPRWLLASGRKLVLIIHDQNIPTETQLDLTQHSQGCTAGTQGRDASLDALLSFLQMEGKGVKLSKGEPAVILPRRICFHQWKIFPGPTKVLAEKATEKMNEDGRYAGWVLNALRMFKRSMTLYYFRPTERKQRETRNWYLSSSIQLPEIPKYHQTCSSTTGSTVIMKPPRDWGFSYILQKQHKTPSSVGVPGCGTTSHSFSVLKFNLTTFKHGNLLLDTKNSILRPNSQIWSKFSTTGHLLKQLVSSLNCPSEFPLQLINHSSYLQAKLGQY